MLNALFPKQIDNSYRGYWLALWLYVPIVLMKFAMGINVAGINPWVSNARILKDVDGIPLDAFGAEAASMLIFFAASWALGLLLLSSLGLLVLMRYRAMIPLMFLLLTIEQVGRKGLLLMNPVVKAVETQEMSPSVLINWALSAVLIVGMVLSLLDRSASPGEDKAA